MSKRKKDKPLSIPPENPKLKIKGPSRNKIIGNINASRDVIMGDQTSYTSTISNIETPAEFLQIIKELNDSLEAIKQSPDLSPAQKRYILLIIDNIGAITVEVEKVQTNPEVISSILIETRNIADILISGGLSNLFATRAILGNLFFSARKLFGES